MAKSGSVFFPFSEDVQQNSLLRATTVNDVIASSIRCYILTTPGQRRGNPIGSFIPTLKQQLVPNSSLQGLSDELKNDLTTQFPGVIFIDVAITKQIDDETRTSDLIVTIQFGTALSDVSELVILV